ncbi:MAG TPA: amidohydrolase family protein [Acidimicrobiales bacterium]|nr:amidohydrolase family protein [Acidimicrobiales bacterium]
MPSRELDFEVFDADNHLYETKEALTKFLPDRYKGAVEYVEARGRTKIAVRGVISNYIPNPTFDVVARPGAQEEYFRNGNPEGKSYRELVGEPMRSIPAFREPAPRLELMDEQGVDRSLMFPTLASLCEERMRDDVELTHATIHALNQWLYETWTYDYEGRIFSTPIITLPIVEKAIEELEWCVERGARVVLIRPAPVPGVNGLSRSPGLPEFDPFWQRVVDLDILVTMHASDSGYARYVNDWEGTREMLPFAGSAFGSAVMMSHRATEDTMMALICHGALSRFPDLRIASVENGSGFVRPTLKALEEAHRMMPQGFAEHPVEVFKRNIYVHPFHEEDITGLIELLGVDHILFGSDYPHPEGLADPISYVDELAGLPHDDVVKIMGGNLAGLMKVPAPA